MKPTMRRELSIPEKLLLADLHDEFRLGRAGLVGPDAERAIVAVVSSCIGRGFPYSGADLLICDYRAAFQAEAAAPVELLFDELSAEYGWSERSGWFVIWDTDYVSIAMPLGSIRANVGCLLDLPAHAYFVNRDLSVCICVRMNGDAGFKQISPEPRALQAFRDGERAEALGDHEACARHFADAARLAITDPDSIYTRAKSLADGGNHAGALEEAQRALEFNPGHPGAAMLAVREFVELGQWEQALAASGTVPGSVSRAGGVALWRALALSRLGRLAEARREYDIVPARVLRRYSAVARRVAEALDKVEVDVRT